MSGICKTHRVKFDPALALVAKAIVEDFTPGYGPDEHERRDLILSAVSSGWLEQTAEDWKVAPGWKYHGVTKDGAIAVASHILSLTA